MLNQRIALRTIRTEMEGGQLIGIALRRAGIRSSQTLINWGNKRKSIKRYIDILKLKSKDIRLSNIRDAEYRSAMKGSVKAQENFLNAHDPERAKKTDGVNVNVDASQHTHLTKVMPTIVFEAHLEKKDAEGSIPTNRISSQVV